MNPIELLRSVTVEEYNELLAALIVMNEQDSAQHKATYPTAL